MSSEASEYDRLSQQHLLVHFAIAVTAYNDYPVAVPGKIFGEGPGPSSFARQQRLSEITRTN